MLKRLTGSSPKAKASGNHNLDFSAMLEDLPTNIMVCDLEEFKVFYVNRTTVETLRTLEHLLPVNADDIIGTSIDVFHKNPGHQRALLSDPNNLPHSAIIEVGGEYLDLLVTALIDDDGTYVAPILSWSIVTDKIKADRDADRLSRMVENMPTNVMLLDPTDFTITFANKTSVDTLRTLEDLLPCKADDLIGQCVDIFHKNPAHQRGLLADPNNLPHQALITLGEHTLDLLVSAVIDADGKYIAAMLTWDIVTEKIKLDTKNTELVNIIEGIGAAQAMIEFEPDGTIITANPNFLAAMEYELSEIQGQHHSIFVDQEYKTSSEYQQFWDSLRKGTFQAGEFNRYKQSGEEIWLQAVYNPVTDAEGVVTKVVKIAVDITKDKLARDKLAADAQRLTAMVENMPTNVMLLEPENFTITYANQTSTNTLRTLENLLPCKADDLVGQCVDIFHKNPSHQRGILANPANLPHKAEIALGDEKLALLVSAVNNDAGEYIAAMLTWEVITDRVAFAEGVRSVVGTVASTSANMTSMSESMAANAEETSSQAGTVSTAAEEMTASISEIAEQVTRATSTTESAVNEADDANEKVKGLSVAAEKIGEVVDLITDIAEQTNLLALNATIEAARAGDAGRGFAVVASEVKNLANQTAKATEEIAEQVGGIRGATESAVSAIEEITKKISEINEISSSVAAAVEEQNAATAEVARNITGVSEASNETGQTSAKVLEASQELAQLGEQLSGQIDDFLNQDD